MSDEQVATGQTVGVIRRTISFSSGEETLVGDLVLPAGPGPHPAILAVAGTGAQNRYGDMVLPGGQVLRHSRYRWISGRLAQAVTNNHRPPTNNRH